MFDIWVFFRTQAKGENIEVFFALMDSARLFSGSGWEGGSEGVGGRVGGIKKKRKETNEITLLYWMGGVGKRKRTSTTERFISEIFANTHRG